MTHAAPAREDVATVIDFACLVALDPQISAAAIRDALLVLEARRPASSIRSLVALSQARAEVFRQLRARNVHPDTAREVRVDGDPLAALTPAERAVLFLVSRRRLAIHDAGFVMDMSARELRRLRRSASVALVRAVTALTLAMDLTPCPVRDALAARGAGMLSRRDITALTMHAAECSICIGWLRRADATALERYGLLPAPGDVQVEAVIADLLHVPDAEQARVVTRAGVLRSDGRPPRPSRLDREPQYWLHRGIGLAVASVVLILGGLMLL